MAKSFAGRPLAQSIAVGAAHGCGAFSAVGTETAISTTTHELGKIAASDTATPKYDLKTKSADCVKSCAVVQILALAAMAWSSMSGRRFIRRPLRSRVERAFPQTGTFPSHRARLVATAFDTSPQPLDAAVWPLAVCVLPLHGHAAMTGSIKRNASPPFNSTRVLLGCSRLGDAIKRKDNGKQ